jgi:hypothetical protein
MNRTNKSFFTEAKVIAFAQDMVYLWPKGIAVNWLWIAFQALEKAGLTYYETEEDEMLVRERLTLLTVFYYEFCHISGKHESNNFSRWDDETIHRIKNDLSDEADDYLFEIRNALIKYFGNEEEVVAELWINCLEGSSNRFITLKEKIQLHKELVNSSQLEINYVQVKDWFVGWKKGIDDFESIAV